MTDGWLVSRHTSAEARRRLSRESGRRFERRRLSMEWLEARQLLTGSPGLSIDPTYQPTSLIVQFRPGINSVSSLAAYSVGKEVGQEWAIAPGMHEVQIDAASNLAAALAAYSDDANVLFAEPNYRVGVSMIPNDPQFAEMWNLQNTGQQPGGREGADIRAPEAWEVTTGSPSVVVAVIDSGVDYNHPDLAANMWTNPGEIPDNGIDDDGNGFVDDVHGYDFVNHDADPMDDYYHGTHVAGTIAAVGNNDIGVTGVAPSVKIMALKFLDATGHGLTSDALAALNYAVANGASISNNSWGGDAFSQAFQTALQNAASHGHIFVAAAGNDGTNDDTAPFYPANYNVNNVVSVAATDPGDSIAWFSNYGKKTVDLAAPGANILSTMPTTMTTGMVNEAMPAEYGTLNGTSMAAPQVAGVVALVKSLHPTWSYQDVIRQVLVTTDPLPSLVGKTLTGGRLNAAAAVRAVPVDTTAPKVETSDPSGPVAGPIDHIRLTFSEAINPATIDESDVVSFNGPDGPIPVLAINPVPGSDRQFDVTFDVQNQLGKYTLVLGPHIADRAGNELDQDGDGTFGVDGYDNYTVTFHIVEAHVFSATDMPVAISGFDVFASYLTIDEDLPIADVNVTLDVTFPHAGNLRVWLVSPTGTSIELSNRRGGDEANFENTTFDDEASTPIVEGVAPFAGSYQPQEPLSSLDVENAQGTWGLFVQNVSETDDVGTLNAWSLEITRDLPPPPPPPPPPPVAVDDVVTTLQNMPLLINPSQLLANDQDPKGNPLTIVWTGFAVGGTAVLNPDHTILFTPTLGRQTPGSFQYRIFNGKDTANATVTVQINAVYPWHNPAIAQDVDNDGRVSPGDAVLIINRLNAFGSTRIDLANTGASLTYFDVVADNIVSAGDAVAVINYINANGMVGGTALSVAGAAVNQATGAQSSSSDTCPMSAAAVDQCLTAGDVNLLFGELTSGSTTKRRLS